MTISARVICDSIYAGGPRLTTMVLKYPRFIHSEFMTHRVFSRNASSSRAIPVQKMIQAVMDDPAMPVFWGKNQSGMQAAEELSDDVKDSPSYDPQWTLNKYLMSPRAICKADWLELRLVAVEFAKRMMAQGLHKQIANRILEPWQHIEVVCTSTDWANFYALRDHAAAQPEIRALAQAMKAAHEASTPKVLEPGQWHLPFIKEDDYAELSKDLPENTAHPTQFVMQKISAARCARVSYLKHDGTASTIVEDLALYDRLMAGDPKHASPCEHQARVPVPDDTYREIGNPESSFKYPSNLRGWTQFRKLIRGETVHDSR